MQIKIESTNQITEIGGVPVRMWRGTTARGVDCYVFVHRVVVADGNDNSQFEAELKECLPPPPMPAVPLSMILLSPHGCFHRGPHDDLVAE